MLGICAVFCGLGLAPGKAITSLLGACVAGVKSLGSATVAGVTGGFPLGAAGCVAGTFAESQVGLTASGLPETFGMVGFAIPTAVGFGVGLYNCSRHLVDYLRE